MALIPACTQHPSMDLDVTWLLQHGETLSSTNDLSLPFLPFTFVFHRQAAKTPRRNREIEQALDFCGRMHIWASRVDVFFTERVQGIILGENRQRMGESAANEVQCPILSLVQEQTSLLEYIDTLLTEHDKSLTKDLKELDKIYPTNDESRWSVEEATFVSICRHIKSLTMRYRIHMDCLEQLLESQLVQATGKYVTPKDFGNLMRFHHHRLFHSSFAPRAFYHAVC